MAKSDTFFLRTNVTTSTTAYVSSDIDISAYTDPARGRVLVVDRAWVSYGKAAGGPLTPADAASGAVARNIGAQACSETQTALVDLDDNSLFLESALYVSNIAGPIFSMFQEVSSMNPYETTGGFIIPTDKIHCAVDCGDAWVNEVDVGFCFEVHTEKLSLRRIQELLVSLTAN
jgi:hypothetical protein